MDTKKLPNFTDAQKSAQNLLAKDIERYTKNLSLGQDPTL